MLFRGMTCNLDSKCSLNIPAYFLFCKIGPPNGALSYPLMIMIYFFYNFQSTLTEVEFIKVTGFLGICFLKRILFKICLYRFLCKKFDLPLRPYPIAKIMIWTNLKLYYMRMLPHKLRLFLPISFWKELL